MRSDFAALPSVLSLMTRLMTRLARRCRAIYVRETPSRWPPGARLYGPAAGGQRLAAHRSYFLSAAEALPKQGRNTVSASSCSPLTPLCWSEKSSFPWAGLLPWPCTGTMGYPSSKAPRIPPTTRVPVGTYLPWWRSSKSGYCPQGCGGQASQDLTIHARRRSRPWLGPERWMVHAE